jgi:excisionase family DNA binding protein
MELSYLDKREAATLLRVTQRTIESWMRRGLLSYVKIGRTVRFRRIDLEKNIGTFHGR